MNEINIFKSLLFFFLQAAIYQNCFRINMLFLLFTYLFFCFRFKSLISDHFNWSNFCDKELFLKLAERKEVNYDQLIILFQVVFINVFCSCFNL